MSGRTKRTAPRIMKARLEWSAAAFSVVVGEDPLGGVDFAVECRRVLAIDLSDRRAAGQ
jgi:hypothetical protein